MRLPPQIRSSRPARRGVALVMFIVLAFAFFAIAGIAIDVGLASLTQQQMQVAVDPAALEGAVARLQRVPAPERPAPASQGVEPGAARLR